MKISPILKPSRKKIAVLIILVILGIIGFNLFGPKKQAPLQFTQVKKQDIKSTISSSGNLTGKNVADLKFKSSGKLAYINVSVGDTVYAGEVIAGLDTQDLAIALQQAQNTLRDKQAIVDKTLDDVKDHSADETFTQRQTRTTAQVARDNAYDSVKAAQRAFQDAVIISPTSGVVTKTPYIAGQVIGSDPVSQIVDFSSAFYFDTEVDEADIGKVSLGQSADVSLDTYPDKILKGQVEEIIPQTKTTSSGATVVTVRINLGTPDIISVNGLSGQASIILADAKDVLTLPQEAVRDDNIVFVQTSQGLKSEKVETGIKSDTDVEIKKGLKEGDRVLLNPPATGSRVNQNRNPLRGGFNRGQ